MSGILRNLRCGKTFQPLIRNQLHNGGGIYQVSPYRSIVMVRGDRVRGAIRDPEEYLTVDGNKYGDLPQNITPLKSYLSQIENGKYLIPDELLLQVITHKSFSHGSKPYNDKLSILGFQLLKYHSSLFVVSRPTQSKYAINELNFDCLGSLVSKNLLHDKCLAQFARENGISKIVFWKQALRLHHDPKRNGEDRVLSSVTSALIGLINLHHGSSVAEEFVTKELLNSEKKGSIIKTAVEMTKQVLEAGKN